MRWHEIMGLDKTYPVNKSTEDRSYTRKSHIAPEIAKVAWEEYHKEHPEQSFERIAERGGFGWHELVTLLYKRIVNQ